MTHAPPSTSPRVDLLALAAGLAFALMWSSAFTSARIIVTSAPPLTALSLRFALSGALAIAIALWLGQSWRLTSAQWRATVLFGLCQNALYLGLNFVAMQWVEASVAAIVASTMPLLVGLLGWLVYRQTLPPLGRIGLIGGFAGVALIMGARIDDGSAAAPLGLAFCALGALALAFATLAVRGAMSGGNLVMVVGLQMLVGSLALAPVALVLEPWQVSWSWALVAAFAYTTLVPGLLATLLWFWLVDRIGAVRGATFHFLNPFFGVAIAALLLGESLGPYDLLGVAIIMAGILAVQRSRA